MMKSLRTWQRWLNGRFSGRSASLADTSLLRLQTLEDRRVPATLFGLTENNQLIRFDSSNPMAAVQISVTGLGATEKLTSIDYRPANETLYGISDFNSSLYTINTTTGAATLIGAAGFTPVATRFGIDFNPTVDRIRFVSDNGNNIRLNPDNGAVVSFDSGINGDTTGLVEVAYTNNFSGAATTQLYGINSLTDSLYEVTNPNSGTTVFKGSLLVDTDDRVGFDIASDDGVAYASLTIGGSAELFSIDLTTGAATAIGPIGIGTALIGLTAAPLLNASPVIKLSGALATYDIQADVPVVIDAGATLTDPDSANFDGGTLEVSTAAGVAGDLLAIRSFGAVTISGNKVLFSGVEVGSFTTGDGFSTPLVITFNASATPAAAQAILRNVVFSTTDNSLMPATRTVTAKVSDGDGGSATSNTQVVDLDDLTPPSVVSIVRADASPTNASLVSFTVTFSEDVVGVGTDDFLVTSTGSIAGTSIKSVTPVDGKTYTVVVENMTGEGTVRLDVTDDESIADNNGNTLGGTGAGNGDFKSGEEYTIDRTNPFVVITKKSGQADPAFSVPVFFFVSFSDEVTGFDASDIIVSGTAGAKTAKVTLIKAGDYEVEVSDATMDGTIVIDIAAGAAFDLAGNGSDAATIFFNSITVDLINDAPVITGPAAPVAATEDKAFTFDGANTISIDDSDLDGGTLTVTITAANGRFSLSGITGLSFTTGDGVDDETMTFVGLQSDVNNAIRDLIFTPNADFFGSTTLTIAADDGGKTGSGGKQVGNTTITLDFAGVNDAPVATISSTKIIVATEDVPFTFAKDVLSVADIDAGSDLVQVTLSIANGTLSLGDVSKLMFSTGDGTSDATMVFTGTIADINAALNGLTYLSNPNFVGIDTITLAINDQGRNGSGGALSDSESLEFSVTGTNDAPVITAPGAQSVDEDTTLTLNGANLISIADDDAGTSSVRVTLMSTNGVLSLSATTGLSFTSGDGSSDASMIFTGSLSDINAALNGLRYQPTSNFNGAASIQITVDDQGNSGSGGSLTDSETIAVNVNPINDAPTAVNDSLTTQQNKTLHIDPPGVLSNDTDPDGSPLSLVIVTDVPAASGRLVLLGNGGLDFVPAANFIGTTTFQYRANDGLLQSGVATVTITVTENFTRVFATGAGVGGQPQVIVRNEDGSTRFSFLAFDSAFAGGVAVATGDVNGDGVEDVIVGASAGGGPHVRVISGANQGQIHSFMAFDSAFSGGVNVAAGDVNGDGFADVIVGAGAGASPHVKVFDGRTGSLLQSFMAFDAGFAGGVSVASGDYDGDGKADVVTGAGAGGGPHVLVYQGMTGEVMTSFYAFDPLFTGGVNVAAGGFNMSTTAGSPDIQPAVFAAAGAGGVPVVTVFNFDTGQQVASFFAFEEEENGGVNIGSDNTSSGLTTLYLAPQRDRAPDVRVIDANTFGDKQTFSAFDPSFMGGVFIG